MLLNKVAGIHCDNHVSHKRTLRERHRGFEWCMQASLLEEAKAQDYVFEYALNKAMYIK